MIVCERVPALCATVDQTVSTQYFRSDLFVQLHFKVSAYEQKSAMTWMIGKCLITIWFAKNVI